MLQVGDGDRDGNVLRYVQSLQEQKGRGEVVSVMQLGSLQHISCCVVVRDGMENCLTDQWKLLGTRDQ